MTVTLTPELEHAVAAEAERRATTAQAVVLNALREKFLPMPGSAGTEDVLGEWELMMQQASAQIAAIPDSEQAGLAALEQEPR